MADDRKTAIESWIGERFGDVLVAASSPAAVELLAARAESSTTPPSKTTATEVSQLFNQMIRAYKYRAAYLLDDKGKEVLAQAGSPQLDQKFIDKVVASGMSDAQLIDFDRDASGAVFLAFSAPIRPMTGSGPSSPAQQASRPLGLVLLIVDPTNQLYPLLLREPTPTKTQEALIVEQRRESLVYLSPLRHRASLPLSFRFPVAAPTRVAAHTAVSGVSMSGEFYDYRGNLVFAATRQVRGTAWGLVVKIDQSEALEAFTRSAWISGVAFFGALAAILAAVYGLWRGRQANLQAAIAQSEARLAVLLKHAKDIVFFADQEGNLIDCNDAAVRVYGYSREDLLRLHMADLRTPEARFEVSSDLGKMKNVEGARYETWHLRKDGTVFPIEVVASEVEIEDQVLIVAIIRDISERKGAEERIRFLNRLLRTITEINQLIVRERDPQTLLTGVCQAIVLHGELPMAWIGMADRVTGLVKPIAWAGPAESYLDGIVVRCDDSPEGQWPTGKAIRERIPVVVNDWESDPSVALWRERAIGQGFKSSGAFPLLIGQVAIGSINVYAREGGVFVDEIVALLTEMAADLSFALDAMHIRSAHQSIESALMESEAKLRAIFESSVDAIHVSQAGLHYLANPAFVSMFGYSTMDELTGKTIFEFIAPVERERIQNLVRQRTHGLEMPISYETRGLRKDGIEFDADVCVSHYEQKGQLYTLAIMRDVTERRQKEKALQESEDRFRLLSEAAFEGIGISDGGVIRDANARLAMIMGYDLVDLVGRPVAELVAPESQELVKEKRLVGSEEPYEHLARRKDGSIFPVEVQSRSMPFAGRTIRVTAIRDITERKKVEAALKASEEEFRAVFENSNDMILILDLAGNILEVNRAGCERLGYSRDELRCIPVGQIDTPENASKVQDRLADLQAHGRAVFETEHRCKNGTTVPTEVSSNLFDYRGAQALLSICRDITERRKAEAVLAQSEARYRITAEMTGKLIYDYDVSSGFITWQGAIKRLTGYTLEEFKAVDIKAWEELIHPDDRELALEQLDEAAQGDGHYRARYRLRRKDGTYISVFDEGVFLRDEGGQIDRMLGTMGDITQEVALETQLRQSQKMEAVGNLAGGVAHDFNNLLQAIMSLVEIIKVQKSSPERVAERLVELEENVRRGAQFTRQLLLFSRRDASKIETLEINDVVRGVAALLHRMLRENITISLELAKEELPVEADRGQLEQIVTNLAINSADAMPEGGWLSIRTRRDEDTVWLEVEDTGEGIPDDVRDHIFEPFFTTKGTGKGTGLGLSVVHGIVTSYDGKIDVESHVGSGTLFRITLSLSKRARRSTPKLHSEYAGGMAEGWGERILVLEDEAGTRKSLQDILALLGYRVVAVRDGVEALALPAHEPFDLMLSDVMLPGSPGPEVAVQLRERWPNLKIILMSGYAQDEAVRYFVTTGNVQFLQKPFDMATLAREIRTALEEDK